MESKRTAFQPSDSVFTFEKDTFSKRKQMTTLFDSPISSRFHPLRNFDKVGNAFVLQENFFRNRHIFSFPLTPNKPTSTMKVIATLLAFLAVANAFAPTPSSRSSTQLSESFMDRVSPNISAEFMGCNERCGVEVSIP